MNTKAAANARAAAIEQALLEGRSLTSIAFDWLRADVIRANLRPGERLRVHALSARYGIGPTAIREALSRLVTEELVQVEDQRGFLVAPVSKADLLDLTEARVELESLTLTRAIERGDTAWESEVLAAYHRLSKCPSPISQEAAIVWSKEHQAFHEVLVSGCGSAWLRSLCRLLYDKSERYRSLSNSGNARQRVHRDDEHHGIMKAVLARDRQLACKLLAAHYRKTTDTMLRSSEAVALLEGEKRPRVTRKAA
jgi:DNA-binding GntR family transcriptional regulator